MRPKKLTLTAFGPFADAQTIDFDELGERSIFVITGPTGAGKTTIFDGIAFALYGDASGESRLSENFKSQYAPIERRCSAELIFQVHQKEYRVVRTPKQIKLGRDGSPRWENAAATLILPDGTAVTGTNEVNARIIALLGLTKEQFKKIVMLPQGEFRKLLEEKNDTKQEIFRKIFSTQVFEKFTRGLVEQAKELEQKLSLATAQNRSILQSVDCGEDQDLRELSAQEYPDLQLFLERLKKLVQSDKKAFEENTGELERLLREKEAVPLSQGEELNRRFDQLALLEREAQKLKERLPEQQKKQELLARLTGCQKGFLAEQAVMESKATLQRLAGELSAAAEKSRQAQTAAADWAEKSLLLPEKEARVSELREKRQQLTLLKEQFDRLDAAGAELENLERSYFTAKQQEAVLSLCAQVISQNEALACVRQTAAFLTELGGRMDRFYALLSVQRERKQRYEQLFRMFLDQQAGFLAEKLRPQTPCPVCGSTQHPAPAKYAGEQVDEARLDEAKAAFESTTGRLQEQDAVCRRIIEKLQDMGLWPDLTPDDILAQGANSDEKTQLFSPCEKELSRQEAGFQRELDQARESLSAYPEELTKPCLKLEREKLELRIGQLGQQLPAVEAQLKLKRASAEELRGALMEKGVSDPGELSAQLEKLAREQRETEESAVLIRTQLSNARAELERYQERVRQLTGFSKTEEEKLTRLRAQFKSVLLESGISSNEEYRAYKERLPELEELARDIEEYKSGQALNSELLRSLKEELTGRQRADLPALTRQKEELTRRYDALFDVQLSVKTRLEQNASAYRRLKDNQKHAQSFEKEYQTVGALAKLANGNNTQRMSFERYVLASYFEDIVASANLRLSQMTGGRYELRRKEEKERHGKGSGLELEVFDSYTGKLRDVSTLSGGESFKASLSLALGLADIVSSYAGGVEIGTMFIDEGFGTLDPESLDSAINTLMQLQTGGRLIGIISHVPELKERIDAKLTVTPAKTGSTVCFEFI